MCNNVKGFIIRNEENLSISLVSTQKEVFDILYKFDQCFRPSIHQKVGDLEIYSKKISQKAITYVCKNTKEEVGFISVYYDKWEAYIALFGVTLKFRRRGVGELLLDYIVSECYKKGIQQIRLEVDKENKNAQLFYLKNGFNIKCRETNSSIYLVKTLL